MQPISIVMTELNEVRNIERVVSNLLSQVPPASEIVVVDGGSTDGAWEWLVQAARSNPSLVPIRDETCNLQHSSGPISRGRNVAISAAKSALIACADAGCTYASDWLRNLTGPLIAGQAEYALGGTCLDPQDHSVWDVASAPFFSIKLSPSEPTKSCTARSMAFTKALWRRIGGFPETVFFAEDTLFDSAVRKTTAPAFVANAKAFYRRRHSFYSAARQMAYYAIGDGQIRVRWSRLFRNSARCLVQLAALFLLWWSAFPFLFVLLLECWFAFHRDWRFLPRFGLGAIHARFAFSIAVPWLIAVNHIRGLLSAKPLSNRQNISA